MLRTAIDNIKKCLFLFGTGFLLIFPFIAHAEPYTKPSWNTITTEQHSGHLSGVAFGNNKFVVVGNHALGVISENNEITWRVIRSGTDAAYGNGLFVVVGGYDTITISNDSGLTWTTQHSRLVDHLYAVTYGNGVFLASGVYEYDGYSENRIIASTDGVTWQTVFISPMWIDKMAYGRDTFIGVGHGTIFTSYDNGLTWTKRFSSLDHSIRDITYGNGVFVAVGGGGTIVSSTDGGITWTARTSGTTNALNGIAFGNGVFAAVSEGIPYDGSKILISVDNGQTWTIQNSNVDHTLWDISYGSGTFVAVGDYCTIIQSSVILPGDMNYAGTLSIIDAISILQIISGMNPVGKTITTNSGIPNNGKMGLGEVLYTLQEISGLR